MTRPRRIEKVKAFLAAGPRTYDDVAEHLYGTRQMADRQRVGSLVTNWVTNGYVERCKLGSELALRWIGDGVVTHLRNGTVQDVALCGSRRGETGVHFLSTPTIKGVTCEACKARYRSRRRHRRTSAEIKARVREARRTNQQRLSWRVQKLGGSWEE